jgi:anti-anti-sigma regulatory factor
LLFGIAFGRTTRKAMLKITEATQGRTTTLRVEGKLRRSGVTELEMACRRHLDRPWALVLDVGSVQFIDESGIGAVRELMRRGVEVKGCSPLVAGLLEEVPE